MIVVTVIAVVIEMIRKRSGVAVEKNAVVVEISVILTGIGIVSEIEKKI